MHRIKLPAISQTMSGRLMMLTAVLLWSTSGLFAKSAVFETWPEEHRGLLFGFWRAVFAAVVLLPFVRRPTWDVRLLPMTATFAVMNASFLSALVLTTAASAIWLQATSPLWVLLMSVALVKYRMRNRDIAFALLCMLGIGTIVIGDWMKSPSVAGTLLGLLSGIAFGGILMWLRLLREHNSVWLIAINQAAAALLILPLILWLSAWHTPSATQLGLLALFGSLQIGLPYFLVAVAVKSLSGYEAAVIGLLEPVLVPLWVALFVGELPGVITLAGAGLILCGLLLRLGGRFE